MCALRCVASGATRARAHARRRVVARLRLISQNARAAAIGECITVSATAGVPVGGQARDASWSIGVPRGIEVFPTASIYSLHTRVIGHFTADDLVHGAGAAGAAGLDCVFALDGSTVYRR